MLKHGELNPLNVHGLRELSWCPPHFTQVQFDSYIRKPAISNWLYENLQGRFYIGDADTTGNRQTVVAFEIAGEASYFSLYLPQINQAPSW